jgi:hypothetical protein
MIKSNPRETYQDVFALEVPMSNGRFSLKQRNVNRYGRKIFDEKLNYDVVNHNLQCSGSGMIISDLNLI